MPTNPDKRHCTRPGCKAWAVRGSDPPLCSPHSGRVGAPPGNANHLIHGYYTSVLHPEETAGLSDTVETSTLDAEILMTRAAIRRLFQMLKSGKTPGADPKPLTAEDYGRYIGLIFAGAGAISRLLRARAALPGFTSAFDRMMEEVLDNLGKEWGVDL
jgi:hypothetical protein